jgi:hypothetical protein
MTKVLKHIGLMMFGFGAGYIAGAAMYAFFVAEHFTSGGESKDTLKHRSTTVKKGINSGN